MTSPAPISVHGLTRSFKTRDGTVDAVRDIDFEVGAGEIVGLLGPNGAGKTTTLRMLTTLLEPSADLAEVQPAAEAAAQKLVRFVGRDDLTYRVELRVARREHAVDDRRVE